MDASNQSFLQTAPIIKVSIALGYFTTVLVLFCFFLNIKGKAHQLFQNAEVHILTSFSIT